MTVTQSGLPQAALKQAVEIAGSQSAFARLLGVTQRAVWRWVTEGKVLPAEHVLTVERETGISRHELRPDIYPLDPAPAPNAGGLEPVR